MGEGQARKKRIPAWAWGPKSTRLGKSLLAGLGAGLLLVSGLVGCAGPAAVGDGYAMADVVTWLDANGDGQRDPGEAPLPWATIHMDYARSLTDSAGRGTVGVFKPGCSRRCWQGESVSVAVPPGYRPTTPTETPLTGDEGTYAFGFQAEDGASGSAFPGEPGWSRAFVNRGLDLTAFHYAEGEGHLELALKAHPASNQDENTLFGDIFDVLLTLEQIAGVAPDQVRITYGPSGQTVVCPTRAIREWTGKLSPAEIVSAYCPAAE